MSLKQQVNSTDLSEYFIVGRENGNVITNVQHRIKRHSPTGFEFGYGGSGPSDLALNLTLAACELAGFIKPRPKKVPRLVDLTYQEVKRRFIENVPEQGARVPMVDIKNFIAGEIEKLRDNGTLGPDEGAVPTPA